jgi:hypothetical protein
MPRLNGRFDLSGTHHIAAINFEAGDHAMPQHPHDIDLALRAAGIAWEKHPYLEHRYGERGRRFTDSDGCWLFALTRVPEEIAVTKSLEWLRTVLASRGIPTVILEFHLRAILQVIGTKSGKQRRARIQFDPFLSDREAERRKLFGDGDRSRLIDVFDRRFRACIGFKVDSAAELIASAWIDEHSGISGSVSALRDWFTDGERFSTDWIANVRELLLELDRVHGQSH